jgi:purine-nucleoside phosphorylase
MRSSWHTSSIPEEIGAIRGAASCAVVLGSGLAGLAETVPSSSRIPYGRVPGMRAPGVSGHPGFVAVRRIGGSPVLLFAGRSHAYEGASGAELAAAVALAARAGCARLVVTCAAGSLARRLRPGTWMLATGLVAFPARLGPDLSRPPYGRGRRGAAELLSRPLARAILDASREAAVPVEEGTLCWTSGPTYETAAEARAAARMGADAVTMSSFPELVAARSFGLEAACLSWITNDTAHVSRGRTDHAGVVAMGEAGARSLEQVLAALLASRAGR